MDSIHEGDEPNEDDKCDVWHFTLIHPKREAAQKELAMPQTLDEFRAAIGVESGQSLLVSHRRHRGQQLQVERVDQLYDGAVVTIHVPRRHILISMQPDIRRKAVMWYPGSTVDQIERAIAKAAGLQAGTPIELRDGQATVVLSTSIPNDTHLEVIPFVCERPVADRLSQQERTRRAGAATPGPSPPTPLLSSETLPRSTSTAKMLQSPSNRSVNGTSMPVRRERSPTRTRSQSRGRLSTTTTGAVNPQGSITTPAAHQSAPEEHCIHILAGHHGFIFCLCGVGDILFTGSQDNIIMIWDLNNLQYIGTLAGHRGFVKCMAASYAKKVLASGSQDRTIRIWSLDSFTTVKELKGHAGGVNALLIVDSADVLVSGSEDKSIRVWELSTFELLVCLDAHQGGVFALERFGPANQVVSGARDRSLKVWDSSSWQSVKTLHPPHYDGVTSIAVANTHGKFYSGSRDRSIKEWHVSTFQNTMHTLHVHGDWVQALCMSTSEEILFSASRDSTVKVWDGDLQCQDILQGHRGPVSALAAVGGRLFSASHDRTVRVWRIDQYG